MDSPPVVKDPPPVCDECGVNLALRDHWYGCPELEPDWDLIRDAEEGR
jgi:hypothetical protein